MNWETHARQAEVKLRASRIPGSEEIISLIKRVNPTSLPLSDSDRERGYRLKSELQNLLLENYGESFRLDRHPYSDNILLIRHRSIPTVDACHTHIRSLSAKALDALDDPPPVPVPAATAKPAAKKRLSQAEPGAPAGEALNTAQQLLAEYDFPGAEERLTGIRIRDRKELTYLIKGVRILVEEMGAYESAAATILSQPAEFQGERRVRELLALSCYGRDMIPEARALLDTLRPDELGKSALLAYADISFRDGNLSAAMALLQLSEAKEGILPAETELRKKIEACMRAEAEKLMRRAEGAFAAGELEQVESLARQALAHSPRYQEARQLLRKVDAIKTAGEIGALWSQYEAMAAPEQRLDLLGKLLELDTNNEERIKGLIATEKALVRRRTADDRLQELATLAAREDWSRCFDILHWLTRQDDAERFDVAFDIAPSFSVLYRNRRLFKLPAPEAKKIWLDLVAVKARLLDGNQDGCLERFEQIKRYFDSYPYFSEEYDRLVTCESEAARNEADKLMKELYFEASSLMEARVLAARLRRTITKLPPDEVARFRSMIDLAVSYHIPKNSEEDNLDDYRTLLLIGNAAKAASLRESISDRDRVASIDRETAEYFAISVEPIAVTVSPDAPLDLTSEPGSPLTQIGESPRHVLFREDEETIIVVDLARPGAARYRSPHFKNLGYLDSLPDRDIFLFANTVTCNNVWRAKLSEAEACFCAEIEVNRNYTYEGRASFIGMFMSSSKDNDYYACIEESDGVRVVKQSLDVHSSTVRSFHLKGEVSGISRASYHPDTLLICTDSGTFLLNSNLDLPHGSSPLARTFPMRLFALHIEKLNVYISDNVVKVLNSKLRIIKQYPNSSAGTFVSSPGVMALCTETDTALISLATGKGTFYDLNSNKFSQTIPLGRLLWTNTPTRWHCFDYDKGSSTLVVKDITHELATLLEWRVICTPDQDGDTQLANIRQFEDPAFFNLPAKAPA
ncbi:DUF4175 domain-containing protein [Geomonas sp. Red69]|uniref:DUF4175 domain-containing protein n=1 Tax=Geomonas diazotrophica TaxID=2843197 RepID=UPI001C0FCCAF|nr:MULTISPECIES: DUF4175 domain-containing protein [Geomonas]MBU5635302.1 DUF4175 domain-containing protein [Geomonas diazotrophica]QXE86781.1 DUF4175 domain-containing protein [Geomonas nitrogeniifigens]